MLRPTCPTCGQPMHRVYFGDHRRNVWYCLCSVEQPKTIGEMAEQLKKRIRGLTWTGFDLLETRGVR